MLALPTALSKKVFEFYFEFSCRRDMKASVATATRYDSVACDKGEVYLPQRSVL